ncbi:MAG: hypothetical protein R3F38_19765 [Gammaproteobacteria bacterium]
MLAVKPQVMGDVVAPLRDIVATRRPLIISIAAGITLAKLQGALAGAGHRHRALHADTPALVEAGATGLFRQCQRNRSAERAGPLDPGVGRPGPVGGQ